MVTRLRMTLRRSRGWFVLAGIVGLAETAPLATANGSLIPAQAPVTLNLRLTVSNELPGISRKALITETESIWRDGHVKLRWLAGSASAESGPSLRVLVTPKAVASASDGDRWTVGELLRFEGSTAIAVASITGAQRIVERSQASRFIDLPSVGQVQARSRARPGGRARDRTLSTRHEYSRALRPDARGNRRTGVRRSARGILPSRPASPGTPRRARDRHWRRGE